MGCLPGRRSWAGLSAFRSGSFARTRCDRSRMFGAAQTAIRHLNRENRGVGENRRVGPEAAAEGQTEIHERSLLRAIKPSIHGLNQGLDRSRIEREGVY